MKKQIAVLMAAATAVTTVAPAIANADVTNHDASSQKIVDEARKALNDKYDNSKANGITIPTGSSLAKDYLNSKYMVLVNGATPKSIERAGFKSLVNSEYGKFEEFSIDVVDGEKAITNKAITNKATDWYVVDDATKLSTLLESNLSENVRVSIVDKGHDDGSSIKTTDQKHYVSTIKDSENKSLYENDQEVSLTETANKLYNMARKNNEDKATFVESMKLNGKDTKYVDDKKQKDGAKIEDAVTKIEVKLTSGQEYTLDVNDIAFDLKKGLDKDDKEFRLFNDKDEPIVTQDVMDKITNFETIDNKDNKEVELDIPNGDTDSYKLQDVTEEALELSNIYTREGGYNSEGKDFVNSIINAKDKPYKFNFRGVNYVLQTSNSEDILLNTAKIDKDGSGYKLTFDVKVKDANDEAIKKTLQFVIKGDKQRDLYDVLRDLKGTQEVVSGHFNKLAGSNRYATAIAVSEEQFGADEADSVVIVGGKAQLDGLAAAPLASAKNAPILLADEKDGLSSATLKEIDRACDDLNRKTVYIVGGEKSVPAKVVKQLEDKFNAVVVRVSGNDRMATSLEVAKRLNYDGQVNNRLFIIGRDGAADAMSASAVASKPSEKSSEKPNEEPQVAVLKQSKNKDGKVMQVSPILVVSQNGISRSTRDFIEKDLGNVKNAYLIGGEKSLSTQVMKDANIVVKNISRVAGVNRYDTNVEVVKEFYRNNNDKKDSEKITVDGAIFASGENDYLVDAQTSGAFAASIDAPIVLTGKKLTNDQVDLMKKDGRLENQRTNIYQVGGVVSSDVMKVVVDKLDL
ncbi:MAG: cell wall-binding repeat-containing protein [Peptostreptococcus sp.]|uniref:cell wall-binding repeat-containing protein n=1 Tax=Peptostreptococcus sp. TaxID=1262 RepID=UPI002FC97220